MEALDVIKKRRSIRKYKSDLIPSELIHQLLDAGFSAPSAQNRKPVDLIVIQDRDKLNHFADYGKYYKMLKDAPCAILVCGDSIKMNNHDFLLNDCSAATQNILLAATALGLGAVWLGIKIEEMIDFYRDECDLPEHIVPIALISIGYPDEDKAANENYDETRVHYEKF